MADDEQFSLCWNNFNTNLSAGFHESLLRGDLVDVTLAAEGHLVKAHRLILSVCSPYFRKMFTQVPVNQHAFIFLKDVSHSALKDLIQFMYCGEVNVKQDALPAFISTAEALQIKGLTETGDSAPVQQSPAKEVITAASTAISAPAATSASPRTKVQRTRVQSYKLDSEESGDDKVQIQPVSHHVASQQVQQQTGSQKRSLQQRTVGPSQASKRTKLSVTAVEALEAPEATQVQTVQIVKQVLDPEYVDLPIVETINTKAEPEYAEETGEIETVETEAEQEQALTEHEQSADQEHGDDDGNYVEDETYGEMSKFEESYFTEGEDGKPGASGFGDSYTSDGGTGTEQSAQAPLSTHPSLNRKLLQLDPKKKDVIKTMMKGKKRPKKESTDPLNLIDDGEEKHMFITSRKGGLQLVYEGFIYRSNMRRQGHAKDVLYWECVHNRGKKCRARLKTISNMVYKSNGKVEHNHLHDRIKVEEGTERDLLEYIHSQRGHPLMVVDDYLFRKNRDRYWRCIRSTKHNCRARLILLDGVGLKCIDEHTHGPETAKIEHGRRMRNKEVKTPDGIRHPQERHPHFKGGVKLTPMPLRLSSLGNEWMPLPKVWYTTPLTFLVNRRGTKNLHFGGYVYVHKKRHNRTENWVCCKGNITQGNCKARVSTEGDNRIRFGMHEHNHARVQKDNNYEIKLF
uniref:BTB domain-containing protein n=1 Tax=Anopheles atroparvus TaxID=41427 RepID=A0A182JL84_ANOAO